MTPELAHYLALFVKCVIGYYVLAFVIAIASFAVVTYVMGRGFNGRSIR